MAEKSDFIPVVELSRLTTIPVKTIYNQHSTGKGPLAPILTKLGSRLGAWRADYEAWVVSECRFKEAA